MVAADALEFTTAVDLVAKRGVFMEEAAPAGSGKMVAVLNADLATIETACQEASRLGIVSPANYNTPSQIVIGGEVKAVDKAVELLKEARVKRLIPLKVSGPFHTALLKPASDKLSKVLATVEFTDFKLPLVGNTEATIMEQGRIKELLTRQVMEPVRFYDSIATMKKSGVTDFIEIGPGKVLSGFIKKIDKSMKIAQVEDITSLSVLLEKKE